MNRVDAERVLRLLSAAFPTYPLGAETVELYVAALTERVDDAEVAYSTVAEWVGRELLFPKVAELIEACGAERARRVKRARALRAAQASPRAGYQACRVCDDTGWRVFDEQIQVPARDGSGELVALSRCYEFAEPCPVCRPDDSGYWRGGHLEVGHDPRYCDHLRCEQRKRHPRRRTA